MKLFIKSFLRNYNYYFQNNNNHIIIFNFDHMTYKQVVAILLLRQ